MHCVMLVIRVSQKVIPTCRVWCRTEMGGTVLKVNI